MVATAEVIREMLADVSEGIRVLKDRDGHPLTEEAIEERARNIVAGLVGNYRIEALPDHAASPA